MISIENEGNEDRRRRFEFNKPYACIELQFGKSHEILPTLSWNTRTILWLDYDGSLDGNVLADVRYFCNEATPGSVLIVTVNAHIDMDADEDEDEDSDVQGAANPIERLRQQIGSARVPIDIKLRDLGGWGAASLFRRIITNEIERGLTERSGLGTKVQYKQLFHFNYQDGARMLTLGGLIYDEGQGPLVASCDFDRLPFVRTSTESYQIVAPRLTYREIRELDTQLPCDVNTIDCHGVPETDVTRYSAIYRYFPAFADTDV